MRPRLPLLPPVAPAWHDAASLAAWARVLLADFHVGGFGDAVAWVMLVFMLTARLARLFRSASDSADYRAGASRQDAGGRR